MKFAIKKQREIAPYNIRMRNMKKFMLSILLFIGVSLFSCVSAFGETASLLRVQPIGHENLTAAIEDGTTNGKWLRTDGSGYLKVNINSYPALDAASDDITIYNQKASSGDDFQVSCTSTSGTFRVANSGRIAIQWMNQSSIDVYICYEATCTTAIGMRYKEDMGFVDKNYAGAITCITASGTATVAGKDY